MFKAVTGRLLKTFSSKVDSIFAPPCNPPTEAQRAENFAKLAETTKPFWDELREREGQENAVKQSKQKKHVQRVFDLP